MNLLCLLDAKVTETNGVKLEFVDSNGEFQETDDVAYKPYFFVGWSLKDEGKEIVKYFSGEIQPVEKIALFSGTKRIYGRVLAQRQNCNKSRGEASSALGKRSRI